jgi:uncharacterized membrane protein YdfJ with MMPL/SSD domain
MKSLLAFISRNPWIYVVLAFLILIAAWTILISIAVKNPQERIEVESHQSPE